MNTKYKNLVHYICHRVEDKSKLGAIKLNKILFFSDFLNYLVSGNSITGEKYIKRQFGPVPSSIFNVIKVLEKEDKLKVTEVSSLLRVRKDYHSLSTPDISEFKTEEISFIDSVIDEIANNHNAKSISESTHTDVWEAAEIGEEIPYNTIFAMNRAEINENDVKWAKEFLDSRNAA